MNPTFKKPSQHQYVKGTLAEHNVRFTNKIDLHLGHTGWMAPWPASGHLSLRRPPRESPESLRNPHPASPGQVATAQEPTKQPQSGLSRPGSHCQGLARIPQPGFHSQSSTARMPQPGLHNQDYTANITQSGLHNQGYTARIPQLGFHSQDSTDSTARIP